MSTDVTATQLSIDRPREGESPLVHDQVVVEGWAWSPDGPPDLRVTVGGRPVEVLPGGWRPDVSAALGIGEIRGYVAMGTVTGLSPGSAEVVVTATGADGLAVERRRSVEVAGPNARRQGRPRPWAGFSERMEPRVAPASLTHAEHVARYRWVAQLAEGREVLDAACGVGFGAHTLLGAGASSVTGVDAFAAAIIEAREQGREGLRFEIGDLRDLPFQAGRFDLVVCFEAIEHVEEQGRVLDEIKRVLRPGGVLAISTPVAGAIAVHNPHHVAELAPDEFHDLLRSRFANVDLRWQHSALASVIDLGPSDGKPAATSPPMPWTSGPLEPLYAVALAGDGELPQPSPVGSLGAGSDVGALITQAYVVSDDLAEARAELAVQRARAARAEEAYRALEQRYADAQGEVNALRAARPLPAPLRIGGELWRDSVKRWQR
jgi:2-polyprenyl-3-methyl-5-hydroxy-6-metoxy-1,4-benzoquinol methylase